MSEIKKNETGFSIVELLVILVIVGLIGFAGWYVWQRQNKMTRNDSDATRNSQQTTASSASKTARVARSGEKSYTFGSSKLYYILPAGWTVEKEQPYRADEQGNYYGRLHIIGPDYVAKNDDAMDEGHDFYIQFESSRYKESNSMFIEDTLKNEGLIYNAKRAMMGNQEAVEYVETNSETAHALKTSTNFGRALVSVMSYDSTFDDKNYLPEPYWAAYLDIVKSVQFE